MYTRSRWGIRSLQVSNTAKSAIWRVEKKKFGPMPLPPQVQVPAGILPTLQVTSLGHGAGEKNAKGNLQRKDAGEAGPLFLAPSSPSSVQASTSTQDPFFYQSISASEAHIPRVATGPVPCHQFTMRCHVRSYMYPVGTPIFWFGSVLELLCVLRDLIRTHQEACSTVTGGKMAKLQILHRDVSIWNLIMVNQARSDWPVDRQWGSTELQKLWDNLPGTTRTQIRRGLLIDWGFAMVERMNSNSELTEADVRVYREPERVDPSAHINVVPCEDGAIRHCVAGGCKDISKDEYAIPPLWMLENGRISGMPTQVSPVSATDGLVPTDWVNEVLGKGEKYLTNAMFQGNLAIRMHGYHDSLDVG
ncbi:hypothetical protein BDR04DRAFT_1165082 [Suillus decipiens]|nr:hypothetical protein BDR04DRAFT_1165082 [Suillus decipiens]